MDLHAAVLHQFFDHLPIGVVVLDVAGRVVIYNTAEERLAGRPRESVLGRDFFVEVAPCMNVKNLGEAFRERIGRAPIEVAVDFSFPFPFLQEPRDVNVKMSSFEVDGAPFGMLLIEDVSIPRSIARMRNTLQDLLVHDLKNPLSAITANLGYLSGLTSVRDAQDSREALEDALAAARRLQAMLLNLLDITRLETNTLPLARVPLDARDIARAAVEDNAANARACGASLELDVPPGSVDASLDAGVLRRALDNLTENALRHARSVVVAAHALGDHVCFEVRDNGPGIPAAVREAIFEKYVLVGAATLGNNRGLGLTFVRLVARAHGGEASVECPVGGGTIFRISVPKTRAHSGRPPLR